MTLFSEIASLQCIPVLPVDNANAIKLVKNRSFHIPNTLNEQPENSTHFESCLLTFDKSTLSNTVPEAS